MKHIKTVYVPAHTKEITDYITCDLCGEKIALGSWTIDAVEISRTTGKSYPEMGYGTEFKFDMCGKCFEEKLVPWLKDKGAEPQIRDWDT